MALIPCKECTREIGSTVKKCPHCGTDQRSWAGRHKILTTFGVLFGTFFGLAILGAMIEDDKKPAGQNNQAQTQEVQQVQQTEQSQPEQPVIVSNNYNDFAISCDMNATALKKKDFFENNLQGKYVMWTGQVSRIDKTLGSYSLQVKHCEGTLTSDIVITMKDDQKDKLLNFRDGQPVTYVAKLSSYGDIMGISADEGEIVANQVNNAQGNAAENVHEANYQDTNGEPMDSQ